MPEGQETRWYEREWVAALASLLVVVTLTASQTIYGVLGGNREFLAVRRVGRLELVEIVLVFNLLPAAVLLTLWGFLRRLHPRLGRYFLTTCYTVLFLAYFLQIHNAYFHPWRPAGFAFLVWVAPAVLLGWLAADYLRPSGKYWVALLPVAVLLPALFLHSAWDVARKAEQPTGSGGGAAAARGEEKNFPPIFLLLLDELPTAALLDEQGEIDAQRFPNFRRLAEESYWFRNATANASQTRQAVPALLTGNYARMENASYGGPSHLFELLEPHTDIFIYEQYTHYCDPERYRCRDAELAAGTSHLLLDLITLYAHRVVPPTVKVGLPEVRNTWGPFLKSQEDVAGRIRRFENFLASLESTPKENVFYYFHHMLPHAPIVLTPRGETYDPMGRHVVFQESLAGNQAVLQDLRERYLRQVEYVDKQVGRFLDRLRELGLYDRALIILTADHGVSWKPEAPGRTLTPQNAELILWVPFFLKLPGQKEGVRSDQDVQHIDLLPTVADLLELEAPERAGRSVFAPNPKKRRKVAYDPRQGLLEFPDTLALSSR